MAPSHPPVPPHVRVLDTVHVCLWCKRQQVSRGNSVAGLHGGDSGEGPAGTTSTLILHWGDLALGTPIDARRIGGGLGVVGHGHQVLGWACVLLPAQQGLELLMSPVAELVHVHVPRVLACLVLFVVCKDLCEVGVEVGGAPEVLLSLIRLLKLLQVIFEAVVLELTEHCNSRNNGGEGDSGAHVGQK